MKKTIVCNIVGLTASMIGDDTPNLKRLIESGRLAEITPVLPAVTCSVQSTYLTGLMPDEHGIVGNGWYFKDLNEVMFWRQSNRLVQGEKIWQTAKKINPNFTCANLFWWYNMASDCDVTITPRPIYKADGRKLPDIYTTPVELRDEIQNSLGCFPLFKFWGPATSIESSQWIMDSYLQVNARYHPNLSLIYIPHLDYNLQRIGPNDPAIKEDIKQVDKLLDPIMLELDKNDARIIVLSEYAISQVTQEPLYLNRVFRKAGWLVTRNECGKELIDFHQSQVFAVCDHQVAHIYINDKTIESKVKSCLEQLPGMESVIENSEENNKGTEVKLNHHRSGDLIAVSKPKTWFSYYYWLNEQQAPDFAPTVDIHRKPGYDPVELFIDPKIKFPAVSIAWRLLKKKLGQRVLMDVIPLDASLVKGSHGSVSEDVEKPVFITSHAQYLSEESIHATDVKQLLLDHVFDKNNG